MSNRQPTSKPKILPLKNGPLYLINDIEPKKVDKLNNSKGETLSHIRGVALCRCGASNNKPFCDGTHNVIRFSSDNEPGEQNESKNKKKEYVGENITIHDNRSICSHSGICVKNLSSVFRLDKKPWIDPNNATKDEIIETARQCPSGALSYSINGTEYKDIEGRDPLITVSKNGPYLITGGIELLGDMQLSENMSKEHYTLCRCGASNNKPFCDGTHNTVNFIDDKN